LAGRLLEKLVKWIRVVTTSMTHGHSVLDALKESLPPALGRALGEGAEVECRHLLGRHKVEKAKYGKVSLLPSAW
jgi:hypothetical protein